MTVPTEATLDQLRNLIEKHWGFHSLRPLQERAMQAILERRDSLLVLPTGGGKSLCYQAPALLRTDETTVVVSPLIALMKDQVDNLQAVDVPAQCLTSAMTSDERAQVERELFRGQLRLLFVSPERLVMPGFQRTLSRLNVRTFVIDEAHCISHWGHDFRQEYRQLNQLREVFPKASVHAFTATATEKVRDDIVRQLGLSEPEVMVGNFDRPNLVYRVVPRNNVLRQVIEILSRHPNEAAIIYCISRNEVDRLTEDLNREGFAARRYRARQEEEGESLNSLERKETQEAFRNGVCDLVVATVAFGMGIDRSDVRLVLHVGMPKSIEHYQQEAGRAGRDGLEAECVLLYSGSDFHTRRAMMTRSAEVGGAPSEFVAESMRHLEQMASYCRGSVCRHRVLVEHFGQRFESDNCGACDLCLGEVDVEPESDTIAKKILSCVARVKERFGVEHVVGVLRGENTDRIRSLKHDQLTTYGLLQSESKPQVRDWVYQLITQGVLIQTEEQYPLLRLNEHSWEVMRSQREVRLLRTAKRKKSRESRSEEISWAGVDRDLFENLRQLRLEIARERKMKPYIIFTDAVLRELARLKPQNVSSMRSITGVGEAKIRDFGETFLDRIRAYNERS